jgi:cytochrome c553
VNRKQFPKGTNCVKKNLPGIIALALLARPATVRRDALSHVALAAQKCRSWLHGAIVMIRPFRALFLGGLLAVAPALDAYAVDKSAVQDIVLQYETCHGLEGISEDKGIPNLAGRNEQYIVHQLKDFRSGKRRHGEMRDMGRLLTDEEMMAVAQHFSKLPH